MSCTFWNLRRRRAAELAKQQAAEKEAPYKVEPAEEKKPTKKVKKDGR
jgi:hypothetical protein